MVDVGTGLAALGTAEVSKDMLSKMLGPTAEYIGIGVRSWTEKRMANVQRVLARAHARLGDDIETPGAVPPRVLKNVLEEGQFAEDELVAQYLGGILAASRSETARDDRAASMVQLVANLSTYALLTHYIFYAALRTHQIGLDADLWRQESADAASPLYIAIDSYCDAMAFTDDEADNLSGILSMTMFALRNHGLIGKWAIGDPDLLQSGAPDREFLEAGIVFTPTQYGVILFSVAHGIRTEPFGPYVRESPSFAFDGAPGLPPSVLVKHLPPDRPRHIVYPET